MLPTCLTVTRIYILNVLVKQLFYFLTLYFQIRPPPLIFCNANNF